MRSVLVGLALAAIACASSDVSAQTPPRISISGRVVADATGDPVVNARVTLAGTPQTPSIVLTDADGRFSVTAPAGRYGVSAVKTGYARRESTPTDASQVIEIRLRRSAAISGRILDEFGEPVFGVRVEAQSKDRSATGGSAGLITATDDNGEYRLSGLSAGPFVVVVVTMAGAVTLSPQDTSSSIRRTYYPGVTTPAEARELSLRPGDDRTGIDMTVAAPAGQSRPFTVSGLTPTGQRQVTRDGGVVRGRVIRADGQPMPHVQISLSSTDPVGSGGFASTTTDDNGRFEVRNVPRGRFMIGASKTGYAQIDESGQPVTALALDPTAGFALAAGEVRERVDVTLARRGALTGRLTDENGDPIQGARVEALQVRYDGGRRWLVPANASAGFTDDLGRYRIHDIEPGQFIVGAVVGQALSGDLPGYAHTFYPGSSNPGDAKFVPVRLTQDSTGIDFALSRVSTATVAGRVLTPAGQPARTGVVELEPSQRSSAVTYVLTGAQISADGAFEFRNVPPGEYVLQTHRSTPNIFDSEGEFGALRVAVNGTDIPDVVLQMSSGSTIAGRVTFDTADAAKAPAFGRLSVGISPVPVDVDLSPQDTQARAEVIGEGVFRLSGLNGPRRLQLSHAPAGWTLKEVRVNGIDVIDQALPFGRRDQSLSDVEVVLTDRINQLSGRITDDRGRPAQGSQVIVFPADRERWYLSSRFLRKTVAGEGGAFTVEGLPADTYYVAAVARIPIEGQDAWQDPTFLESLVSRASTVTLGDEQKASVTLRVSAR